MLWLSNGDRNTKKFHQVANSPRTFNSITNLLVDGELTTNPATIFESITQFCKCRILEGYQRPVLDKLKFSRILEENVVWLNRPFD